MTSFLDDAEALAIQLREQTQTIYQVVDELDRCLEVLRFASTGVHPRQRNWQLIRVELNKIAALTAAAAAELGLQTPEDAIAREIPF